MVIAIKGQVEQYNMDHCFECTAIKLGAYVKVELSTTEGEQVTPLWLCVCGEVLTGRTNLRMNDPWGCIISHNEGKKILNGKLKSGRYFLVFDEK